MEIIHVLPINDTKQHEETKTCHCNPDISQEAEDVIIVVHHAYDCRELFEEITDN